MCSGLSQVGRSVLRGGKMYDILASIHVLMGDPVFRVCPGSRIRAPSSETREIHVIPYHYGASPRRSRCLKDSLLNIHHAEEGSSGLIEGTGDAPAVRARCPVHAGRGRSLITQSHLCHFNTPSASLCIFCLLAASGYGVEGCLER
jgi:hypothetical protein